MYFRLTQNKVCEPEPPNDFCVVGHYLANHSLALENQERSDDWKFGRIRRQHELGLSPQTLPYDLEKIFRFFRDFVCWRYRFWRTMRHTYPTPPRLSQAPEAVNESEASRDKKMALDQPVVSL